MRVIVVGRSARAAHVVVYLLDDTNKRVSYVMEEIFLHIDMETRHTAEWPAKVADGLDKRIARDAERGVEPSLSARCVCADGCRSGAPGRVSGTMV